MASREGGIRFHRRQRFPLRNQATPERYAQARAASAGQVGGPAVAKALWLGKQDGGQARMRDHCGFKYSKT